ncbi:MAG: M20/M25/M40 family metallo-hydrolase, partial [Candidatus Limivicinus sp.]|nr:M20/M25/M40 family metallo-hydrolase [Candidatus Limivicinus sp.]
MSEIKTYVESIFDELVAIRRDIHAHPETGSQEVRTSALIRAELEKMGMDEIQSPLPTAVVGLLHGKKGPGKCVGLRADIDALPVHEDTGLPFASQNEGVMHACGHDL